MGRRPASLRRRLLVFGAALLAPVLAGALVSGLVLLHSARTADRLAAEVVHETSASSRLFERLEAGRLAGDAYLDAGASEDLAAFGIADRGVMLALDAASYDEGQEWARLARIEREWRAAARQLRARTQGTRSRAAAGDGDAAFEAHADSAIRGVERLVRGSEREITADLADARRLQRAQPLVALAALFVSLAIAAFLARRLSGSMLRPIRRLTRAARAFGGGQLSYRVMVSSPAELHEMADTFNGMAAALQRQHEQLERQAFTDPLTGIPNRSLYEKRTSRALQRTIGTTERIAVLIVDLDDVKLVNDGLGHACGDEVIADAARRIRSAVRPVDTVARLGGDEFAVLLEHVRGMDDALGAAERLRKVFDAPFVLESGEVVLSASVGIALSDDSLDADELLRRADLAMYRVKEQGKNGAAFFDAGMDDRTANRLETLSALRTALEREQLVAHYQPIVSLETGQLLGAEALLRWARPGYGLVQPADFIPLAEETGLIQPLGAWILREACTQACEWRRGDAGDVRVGVNVSARQLIDPQFERTVSDTLAQTGLEPEALVLEVTESSVMHDADVAIAKLHRIARTGVRLTLDDFGEGYSSLSHIRRLPLAGLKIAKPFVEELADPAADTRLIQGIIELSRSLGLHLVAEGIEQSEQRDQLRRLGCPSGQGFLFSKPLDATTFRTLVRDHQPSTPVRLG